MKCFETFLSLLLLLFTAQVSWGLSADFQVCRFNLERIIKRNTGSILTIVPDLKRLHNENEYEKETKLGQLWNLAVRTFGEDALKVGDHSFTARAETIQKFVQQMLVDNAKMTRPKYYNRNSLVGSFGAPGFLSGSNLMSTGMVSTWIGGGTIRTQSGRIEPGLSDSLWIPYFLLIREEQVSR